jgi:hypothetical protein
VNETAEFIARVLRAERQAHEGFAAQVQAIDNVALHFASALRVGDAHFSRTAFLVACGASS